MLMHEPIGFHINPFTEILLKVMNSTELFEDDAAVSDEQLVAIDVSPREITYGVYECQQARGMLFLQEDRWDEWPIIGQINSYGVCDSIENVLATCPMLMACKKRRFIIFLTKIERAKQPKIGGWRWEKWGPYIGDREPQREYLYDEPVIDHVYCYSIYERRNQVQVFKG